MNMKLREIIENMEKDFYAYSQEGYKDLAIKIEKELRLNLFDLKDATKSVTDNLWLLLDKYKEKYYKVLETTDFKVQDVEFNYIIMFMLNCANKSDNLKNMENILIREKILTKYEEDNGDVIIDTKYGTILFRRALDEFNDDDYFKDIKNKTSHEIAEYLISRYDNYKAVTSISVKDITKEYFHSFILDENTVIDIKNNLIMDKETYYDLFMIEELNVIKYTDFLKQRKECLSLLENAININNNNN